jgi:tetratricopeptide (TPR) repeat protein
MQTTEVAGGQRMTAEKDFMEALGAGRPKADLHQLGQGVQSEMGALAWARCLDSWIETATETGLPQETIEELQVAQAETYQQAAIKDEQGASAHFILAYEIYRQLNHTDKQWNCGAAALLACSGSEEDLKDTIVALGGKEEALKCMKKEIKRPEVKKDSLQLASCREQLAHIYKSYGDVSRAFFEMLKAFRKVPTDASVLDETFALAIAAERGSELVEVLMDLVAGESLSDKKRATLCNKTAHLQERVLKDQSAALRTYEQAHELNPKIKGPVRNIERLKKLIANGTTADEKKKTKKRNKRNKRKNKTKTATEVATQELDFLQHDSLNGVSPDQEQDRILRQIDSEIPVPSVAPRTNPGDEDSTADLEPTAVTKRPEEFYISNSDHGAAVFAEEQLTEPEKDKLVRNPDDIPTEQFRSPFAGNGGSAGSPFSDSVFTSEEKDTSLSPSDVEKIEENFAPDTHHSTDEIYHEPVVEKDEKAKKRNNQQGAGQIRSNHQGADLTPSLSPDQDEENVPPPLPEDDGRAVRVDEKDLPPPMPLDGQFPQIASSAHPSDPNRVFEMASDFEEEQTTDTTRIMSVAEISDMTDIEGESAEPPSFADDKSQSIPEDEEVEAARAAVLLSASPAGDAFRTEAKFHPRNEHPNALEVEGEALSPFDENSLPQGKVHVNHVGQKPVIVTESVFEEASINTQIENAIEGDDLKDCERLLHDLDEAVDTDARLALLERTLVLQSQTGIMDRQLLEQLVSQIAENPTRGTETALAIRSNVPSDCALDYEDAWVAIAKHIPIGSR